MSLYGTRDAAANWQKLVSTTMHELGFTEGRYNPCTFHHGTRQLKGLVHGDDFVFTGSLADTKWVQTELAKKFEIKAKTVGLHPECLKETRVLNRVVRVTEDDWEYEADQRHADLLVEGLGLERAKSVLTPGEKTKSILENDSEFQGMDHRMYRALAARANYLALDRPDIQFATKEICRAMLRTTNY